MRCVFLFFSFTRDGRACIARVRVGVEEKKRVLVKISRCSRGDLLSLSSGGTLGLGAAADEAGGLRTPEREDDVDDALQLPHPLGPGGAAGPGDGREEDEGENVERDGLLGEGVL